MAQPTTTGSRGFAHRLTALNRGDAAPPAPGSCLSLLEDCPTIVVVEPPAVLSCTRPTPGSFFLRRHVRPGSHPAQAVGKFNKRSHAHHGMAPCASGEDEKESRGDARSRRLQNPAIACRSGWLPLRVLAKPQSGRCGQPVELLAPTRKARALWRALVGPGGAGGAGSPRARAPPMRDSQSGITPFQGCRFWLVLLRPKAEESGPAPARGQGPFFRETGLAHFLSFSLAKLAIGRRLCYGTGSHPRVTEHDPRNSWSRSSAG